MPATTADTLSLVNRSVTVAPLVLLSVADHYGRTAKGTRKRVVGVLLGENHGNNVRVSNSFAGMSELLTLSTKLAPQVRLTKSAFPRI
jgi:26S proteasome regulatory subunit N8